MKKFRPIIVLVLVAAAAGGWYYFRNGAQADPGRLLVSGNIEVIDVDLSFRIAGWVKERPVDEGDSIKEGQLVAQLDPVELQQQVDLSQAEVNAAQAALDELNAGSRPQEIAEAKAAVNRARADADFKQKDLARVDNLYARSFATIQERDLADSAYKAADAALQEEQEKLKLVVEGPRIEEIHQAQAKLNQAKAGLEVAKTKLGYTTLLSPVTGVVLAKNVEAGEFVTAGTPIVTVADLRKVFLRVYVNETDLGRVKLGQKVQVRTDTFPDKTYEGVVSFLSSEAEFTPKNVQTTKERVKLVYRTKIDIDNPHMELKPGMPADAEILLGH